MRNGGGGGDTHSGKGRTRGAMSPATRDLGLVLIAPDGTASSYKQHLSGASEC